jgi:hypothetical protein
MSWTRDRQSAQDEQRRSSQLQLLTTLHLDLRVMYRYLVAQRKTKDLQFGASTIRVGRSFTLFGPRFLKDFLETFVNLLAQYGDNFTRISELLPPKVIEFFQSFSSTILNTFNLCRRRFSVAITLLITSTNWALTLSSRKPRDARPRRDRKAVLSRRLRRQRMLRLREPRPKFLCLESEVPITPNLAPFSLRLALTSKPHGKEQLLRLPQCL